MGGGRDGLLLLLLLLGGTLQVGGVLVLSVEIHAAWTQGLEVLDSVRHHHRIVHQEVIVHQILVFVRDPRMTG